MDLIKSTIYQLSWIVSILIVNCTGAEPTLNPDYTGQEGEVSDVEGHIYKTIGIGSQIWMAENLRTIVLNDASRIYSLSDDSLWNRTKSPGFCWYNNDSSTYGVKYGALYNFYAVRTGLLCPVEWHVPDKSEWETLISFLGGYDIAGGKLKDYHGSYWQSPNHCIVNNFGFSALPGGQRLIYSGRFDEIGLKGYWWTSSLKDSHFAYAKTMSNSSLKVDALITGNNYGFSVRCIKDQ